LADKVDALIAKVDALQAQQTTIEAQQTIMNNSMTTTQAYLAQQGYDASFDYAKAHSSCIGATAGTYQMVFGGSTFAGYCDGKGYLLVGKWGTSAGNYGTGPCGTEATAPNFAAQSPLGGGCSLADTALASGSQPCRLPDSLQNDETNLPWTKYKITASTSAGPDAIRSIITPQHFEIQWCEHFSNIPGGINGMTDRWCYENVPYVGDQCELLTGTNTYGVSPHEGSHGGHWIHGTPSSSNPACSSNECGFSCGFASIAESGCTIFEYQSQHWLYV
jgi:hypothetical protein